MILMTMAGMPPVIVQGEISVEVVDEGPHHHQLLCRCWIHVRLEAGETAGSSDEDTEEASWSDYS